MADIDVSFYPKAPASNALLDTAGGYVGLANSALANRQAHMDLVKGQVDYLANGMSTLASKPDLTAEDMLGFGRRAVEAGILDPNTFQVEMQQVNAAGNDPEKLRALAQNYQLRALDAGQRFTAQYGSPTTIDTGNSLLPATVSPMTGIHPIGNAIPKTLSPGELAQPATVMRDGVPMEGTRGQALEAAGVNPLTAMPSQPAATSTNPLLGSEAPQAAQRPTFAPVPVGATEAAAVTGQQSGTQFATDLGSASNYQNAVAPLEKAIPALEALGSTGTGPGTEQLNEIKSFLQSMGMPIADAEQIKNFDEARKYLTQFARGGGNGSDPNTNDKLAAAFAGNPSVNTSNAAAVDIAKTALSLSRLQNAQVRAFQASGQPESQYSKWAATFNASQDPRAYGFDLMSPAQRTKLIEGMSEADKTKFVQSLRRAVELGLVKAPNAGQ